MSERVRHDAAGVAFPEDEFLEQVYSDDPLLDDVYGDDEDADEDDQADGRDDLDAATNVDGEPVPTVVAAPAPHPAAPALRADDVDGLAEPQAEAPQGVPVRADHQGLRERIRSSRYGTLIVLIVTAALVAGGLWLVNGAGKPKGETLANGATAVSIPGKSTVPAPKVGSPAQNFTVTTIDGKQVSLEQFRGQPVWIVFGASWCAGCQAEVPEIEAAYEKYGPQGLVVLGVNITEDTATVRDYAKRVGITHLIAADPESAVADAYRVSAIPAHFFVDKAGVLREIRQGSASTETIENSMRGLMTP